MRVAVVFDQLDPEFGGGFTFAHSLYHSVRAIESEAEHSFVYYTAAGSKPDPGVISIPAGRLALIRRGLINGLRFFQDQGWSRRWPGFRTWFERSLAQQEVDLVWFATTYSSEVCELPYIFTVWDLEYLRQPWFPELSRSGEWVRRHNYFGRYLPPATRVIVPNEAGAHQVLHSFPVDPGRILCLHHPTPEFALEAARAPRSREVLERHGVAEPYLFYPAQFWAHKNHLTLLRALAELNGPGEERLELVCVGADKGQLEHVRRLAQEVGLEGLVHFLGFVDVAELIELYQNAFALVYLSVFGPENLPPLEAMALGCPVVVGDVPGAEEQMQGAARIVSVTDPAAVARAVRELRDKPTRDRLVAAGRERARRYRAADYVQDVLSFLDEFEQTRRNWQ